MVVNPAAGRRPEIRGPVRPEFESVLTPQALQFLADLTLTFGDRRNALLGLRAERRLMRLAGERPDFLPETAGIRRARWQVAPIAHDLRKRHVEITGPVDRKMIINALNSGADIFMAD